MRPLPAALLKGRHFTPEIIILWVRRYLRYALRLRNLEEIMTERNSAGVVGANFGSRTDLGASTKPIFALRASGPVYRGRWILLAKPSISCSLRNAMQVLPSFFQKARSPNHPRPRVINVDGRHPAYPNAIDDLKRTRELIQLGRCRPVRDPTMW